MQENGNQFSDNGKQGSKALQWDDTRVFLAIARSGTLSAAAKILGLGLATVSRRIERLEMALGITLFTRDQGGYKLTDDGLLLVSQAETLEAAGNAFSTAAQGFSDQIVGHVRLATAQGLADGLIIPALPGLLQSHPNLSLEIVPDIKTVNLQRRDADLALRMVRPEKGNLHIRRLGVLGFGLYASADYLHRHPQAGCVTEHETGAFIRWSESQQQLPAAQWMEQNVRGQQSPLTTSTLSSQLSGARAGLGMAILPHFLALNAGLLCVRNNLDCDQPIWLVIHADLAHSRRVRLVADFLCELVEQQAEWLLVGEVTAVKG